MSWRHCPFTKDPGQTQWTLAELLAYIVLYILCFLFLVIFVFCHCDSFLFFFCLFLLLLFLIIYLFHNLSVLLLCYLCLMSFLCYYCLTDTETCTSFNGSHFIKSCYRGSQRNTCLKLCPQWVKYM